MKETQTRKRSALIACGDEWMCRSLQSLFEERGYTASRVGSGKQALKDARYGSFDVVLLDEQMHELTAVQVCEALRDDPLFDHATPIVITSSAHATPRSRTAAYTAGAWEYCQHPLDVDGLFLKLGTFLRAREEMAQSELQRLTDPASGLYTPYGLQQVSEQLSARALRRHEPFACVAVSQQMTDREVANDRALTLEPSGFADIASVVRVQSRKSDIVGQMGDGRLAILAPDTDAKGARLLVARLQREFDASRKNAIPGGFRLRAGFCAVDDFAAANVEMKDLVQRAESALDRAWAESGSDVLTFDELPRV
jgi:DNA-binding response OmpR family regulator